MINPYYLGLQYYCYNFKTVFYGFLIMRIVFSMLIQARRKNFKLQNHF